MGMKIKIFCIDSLAGYLENHKRENMDNTKKKELKYQRNRQFVLNFKFLLKKWLGLILLISSGTKRWQSLMILVSDLLMHKKLPQNFFGQMKLGIGSSLEDMVVITHVLQRNIGRKWTCNGFETVLHNLLNNT